MAGLLTAVALAGGAWYVLRGSTDPLAKAAELASDDNGRKQAVALYRQALRRDSASPYRWADLADALSENNQPDEAKSCMDRAVELGRHIPPILIRSANLALTQDRVADLLTTSKEILGLVPDYDEVVFGYLDRVCQPSQVIGALGDQKRPQRAWMAHLIAVNNAAGAQLAWQRIASNHWSDPEFTASFLAYLLRGKDWDGAVRTWSDWLGDRRGDYPARNLLFNGEFAQKPSGSPLDWNIEKDSDLVETSLESNSLRIHFLGKDNVNYAGVKQMVVLPRAGAYRLSAKAKAEGLTTNEGVRIEIKDLGVSSPALNETHGWTPVSIDFTVKQARSAQIEITRHPSAKFDNKIQGTVWFTHFRLTSLAGSSGETGEKP